MRWRIGSDMRRVSYKRRIGLIHWYQALTSLTSILGSTKNTAVAHSIDKPRFSHYYPISIFAFLKQRLSNARGKSQADRRQGQWEKRRGKKGKIEGKCQSKKLEPIPDSPLGAPRGDDVEAHPKILPLSQSRRRSRPLRHSGFAWRRSVRRSDRQRAFFFFFSVFWMSGTLQRLIASWHGIWH